MKKKDIEKALEGTDLELVDAKQVDKMPSTIDLVPGLMEDGKLYRVQHFFDFPTKAQAKQATEELARQDRIVQIRYFAYSKNWSVYIFEFMTTETDMLPVWQDFSAFAARFGGNYDGWETEIKMKDEDWAKLDGLELKPFPTD